MIRFLSILLLLTLFLGGCAKEKHISANQNKVSPRTDLWALLIGISEYKEFAELERRIPNLAFAAKDAEAMKNVLQQKAKLSASQTELLINERATKANILDRITHWLANVPPDNIVIIYYSGHGSVLADLDGDEGDGYDEGILPHNTDRTDPRTMLSDDELAEAISLIPAKSVILIFDSCYSGGANRRVNVSGDDINETDIFAISGSPAEPTSYSRAYFRTKFVPLMRSDRVEIDLSTPNHVREANYAGVRTIDFSETAPAGQVFLVASQPNESAIEVSTLEHGAFTYYLLEGLREGYADLNQDGRISVEEWYDYADATLLNANVYQQPVYLNSNDETIWIQE